MGLSTWRRRGLRRNSCALLALSLGAALAAPGALLAQAPSVSIGEGVNVESGGVAVIGANGGVTINKPDDIATALRAMGFEPGIPEDALRNIIKRFGERVPEGSTLEDLRQILERKAEEYLEFQERFRSLPPARDPRVQALRERAGALIETADYEAADELLAEAADLDRGLIAQVAQELLRSLADTLILQASGASLAFRYEAAAEHHLEAAQHLRLIAPDEEHGQVLAAADALYRDGDEFGRRASLERAISLYERALGLAPRERVPFQWASTQNNLGGALKTLGEREGSAERLEEAVEAFRAALLELTRARVPLQWAAIQSNLGGALLSLGEREGSAERIEEAVEAFRTALLEQTREHVPLDWAATQMNLGATLATLGVREGSARRLEEAIEAYRAALLELTRERAPLQWAMTQNNLGNALATLGTQEGSAERLEEAVEAYRAALLERTRERVPLQWATTQRNLGNALATLGTQEGSAERLEEAVEAYRAALLEQTRERVPLGWAMNQMNLGNALLSLGEQEGSAERIEEAVEAYRAALLEQTRERVPLGWATTQNNLGNALATLGTQEGSARRFEEAISSFEQALSVFRVGAPSYATMAERNLRRAQAVLARLREQ